MRPCAKSWGSTESGWTFCIRAKGHAGNCFDHNLNPPNALFFHDQPEAQAAIERQRAAQAKIDAKKA